MYPRDVEEIMWHFIGYFYMADVSAKARLSYEAFRTAKAREEEASDKAEEILLPQYGIEDLASAPATAWYVSTLWLLDYKPGELHILFDPPEVEVDGSVPRLTFPKLGFLLPMQVQFSWSQADLEITITYAEGGKGQAVFSVYQANFMTNQNMLTFGRDGSVWEFHDAEAVDAKLGAAFANVAQWTPAEFVPENFTHQALVDLVLTHSAARAEGGPEQDPAPLQHGKYITESGTYINGELQEPEEEEEVAFEADAQVEGSESPLAKFAEGANQIMSLGGNTVANTAIVVDATEGWGSIIILGDYHKLDGIFQFNIYHGATHVTTNDLGLAYDWEKNMALAENVATFTNDTESAFGNGALAGVFPGLKWNVDIHEGDFWDITMIRQENWLMSENFAAHVGQGWGSDVALGYNHQVNVTEIWNYGFHYDLIIVEGNKYDYNFIYQTNILLNDNIIFILTDEDGQASVSGGSNELLNEASIVNYGNGDMLKPMTPEVEALVQLFTDRETSISIDDAFFQFASTLPGNGTNEFNVLYVTGDFYKLTLLEQVNVLIDMNVGIQAPSDHDNGFEGDSWAQFVEAGGNTAINLAAIINVNSTSEFQYLGGDKYHDMLLLQEEMVAEDYQLVYKDTQKLVPEVIAFLEAPEEENEDGYPVWTENQAGQDEGFSGVLT